MSATCYINSLVQVLRYIDEFRSKLSEVTDKCFYKKLLNSVYLKMDNNTIEDDYLKKFINNLPFVESPDRHEDVHEFARILFDKLENEDKTITKMFEGKTEHVFKCECGCEYKREGIFQELILHLNENFSKSFQDNIKPNYIDDYKCEKHEKTKAVEKLYYKELPKYLFVLIKRFEYDWDIDEGKKINDYFNYPEEFNFYEYVNQEGKNDHYTLKGNIVHYGSFSEGHFYCYINIDGKYYKFDDTKVYEVVKDEVLDWNYGGKNIVNNKTNRFSAYYLLYENKDVEFKVDANKDKLSIIEEKEINYNFVFKNDLINFNGPLHYNFMSDDYVKRNFYNGSAYEYQNAQCVFRNLYICPEVFSLTNFKRIKDTGLYNDLFLVHYDCKSYGKLVFVKEFDVKYGCSKLNNLLLVDIISVNNLSNLKKYNKKFLYKENEDKIEQVEYDYTDIKDGDIFIVSNEEFEKVNQHLNYLRNNRYVYVNDTPLFVSRNDDLVKSLNKSLNTNMINEVKLLENNSYLIENNEYFIFYVCFLDKNIDFNAVSHIHYFYMKKDSRTDDLIKKFRESNEQCFLDNNNCEISLFRTSFDNTLMGYNLNSNSLLFESDIIKALFVITPFIENTLVIKFSRSGNYPTVTEMVDTVKEFRSKHMYNGKISIVKNDEITELFEDDNINLNSKSDYLLLE